jgi:heme exporter protein D
MSAAEFFAMGGYAPYIWGVYAIAAVVLTLSAIQPILQRRRVLKRLRNYYRLKSRRQ